ncbi:HNH endonuclease family protein [Stomatohabitans albus]|uniref:HNH endonuclease family protein n=1 Tax=Stomatohabitans albus TaxID=3110766 RepID=UPI00300DB478
MKNVVRKALDSSGLSAIVAGLGLLVSLLLVFAAGVTVLTSVTADKGNPEERVAVDTVVLEPVGLPDPTPEPIPTIELPPLVLPERTHPPVQTPIESPQDAPSAPQLVADSRLNDSAREQDQPNGQPARSSFLGRLFGPLFGAGNTSTRPAAKPKPTQSTPSTPPSPTPSDRVRPTPSPTVTPEPPALSPVPPAPVPPPAPPVQPAPPAAGDIAVAFAALPVKPEDTRAKYNRNAFGKGWTRTDGCYTRQHILARDLQQVQRDGKCKVVSGVLHDPYTGKVIQFVAGKDTSDDVQIDHVVALRDAWGTGAQDLAADRRIELMNDPLNLLAVDGPTNNAKGHKNAAAWLPPNSGFHCHYVARQVAVKQRYHLWVTPQEHDAMAEVLAGCPPMRMENNTITS